MPSTTSSATVRVLHHLFAACGLPLHIVLDNVPQCTSEKFTTFLKSNGVRHTCSAPYQSASKGLVERFMRTFKQAMKCCPSPRLPLQHYLANFLFGYRSTPHSIAITGRSPIALFLGRELRTCLNLLKPNCEEHVLSKQSKQAQHHTQQAKRRCFEVRQQIMACNYGSGHKWCPAVVKSHLGPVTLLVETDHTQTWKRHHDQLRSTQLVPDPTADVQ